MRESLRKLLNQAGYTRIIDAVNGKEAWDILNAAPSSIDLIFSDWNMPLMSGLELLKYVRGDFRFKKLPFIMVTTENEKGLILQALKAGVTNYMVKPYTLEIVVEKLKTIRLA